MKRIAQLRCRRGLLRCGILTGSMSAWGQKPKLPQCSINACFALISRHKPEPKIENRQDGATGRPVQSSHQTRVAHWRPTGARRQRSGFVMIAMLCRERLPLHPFETDLFPLVMLRRSWLRILERISSKLPPRFKGTSPTFVGTKRNSKPPPGGSDWIAGLLKGCPLS